MSRLKWARFGSAGSRGFTLIELMIALAIGSFGLAAAANVVQWATRKSGQGQEKTEETSRARIVAQQLRQDLALAGYGSSGIISMAAARCTGNMCVTSFAGGRGAPAIRGFDNVGASVSFYATQVKPHTDMIQVVVPNPATAVPTDADTVGGAAGTLANADTTHVNYNLLRTCITRTQTVYIVDHGGANGASKAFVGQASANATDVTVTDALTVANSTMGTVPSFNFPTGALVMCGRISMYYVDINDMLHRVDWVPTAAVAAGGDLSDANSMGIFMTPSPGLQDVVAAGVEDLQLAYGMSSFATPNPAPGANFAFGASTVDGIAAASSPLVNGITSNRNWFEVRAIRFTLVMRGLRSVEDIVGNATNRGVRLALFENQDDITSPDATYPVPRVIPIQFQPLVVTGASDVPNLRIFDDLAEATLEAEPL
ncbi:MAG: prepilin-type N-terminal cleavage/methylation domain-containing protein [Deltaproteobacteria bacterium]|nr:prepilin-type N-terminal cleavage/methylation domain-containing protein [Deltaproteobacteria bacterium]